MEQLYSYHNNLLKQVDDRFYRYAYSQINWDQRLIGILGARGVGKTTMMLQRIKFGIENSSHALYVTADHPWFYSNTLLELADQFQVYGGHFLFIDEIHKYPSWSSELKTIYDGYPDLQIIFSASSALEILKGEADLSRRVRIYDLCGLSFREYLKFVHKKEFQEVSYEDIFENHQEIAKEITQNFHPLPAFSEYLQHGYYPFTIEGSAEDYMVKLQQVLNVILEYDLSDIEGYSASNVHKIKRLLGVIAESAPYEPNISAIARKLGMGRDTVLSYLHQLKKGRILNLLRSPKKGSASLQKPDKIYLENTNLSYALKNQPNRGTLRETFAVNQLINAGNAVDYPKSNDILLNKEYLIEVGGKNKNVDRNDPRFWVAADDLEIGFGRKIPLWLLGFLY